MRVRSREIETGAVNGRVLGRGSVGRRQVARWAVAPGGLLPGAVGTPQLAPGAVTAPELADSSVSAPKLEDGSVTPPALADGAVTAPALADGSVTGPKVPEGALGARELADGSITLPKYMEGTRPVQLVEGLPALPDAEFGPGAVVVNLSDGKVYRATVEDDSWDAEDTWGDDWGTIGWDARVDTFDLRGLLLDGNVGDDFIKARMVAADQIGATELAAIFVEVDKWIRSWNWEPGQDGWAIDGDGYFELAGGVIRGNTQIGGVVTEQIVSTNYGPGVTGWAVDGTGNVEFNDGTFRGNLEAVSVTAGQLKSPNYTSSTGTAGWALDANGNAHLNNATFRGNIRASSVTSGQLKSPNYAAGSAGWALDAAGNAEFNDATFRGNIRASSVTSGQLVSANYSAGSQGWALDANGNVEFNDGTFRGNVLGATITGSTFQTTASPPLVIGGAGRSIQFSNQSFINNVGTFGLRVAADPLILAGVEYTQLGAGQSGQVRSQDIAETLTSSSPSLRVATVSPYQIARESSSQSTKLDIEDVDWDLAKKVLDFRPVWFRSDPDLTIDPAHHSFYGFIAEELDAAGFPQLVDYDGDGRPAGVAYDRIPVLMLAVMQDQQARIEQLEAASA